MCFPKFGIFIKRAFGLILVVAFEGGCLQVGLGASKEVAINSNAENISSFEAPKDKKEEKIIVFFLIINETGKDILLKAIVDGKELFVKEVRAEIKTKKYPREAPPCPGKYPAKELKVEIRKGARNIELQETYSKRKAIYDITDFSKKAGGFRINVTEDVMFFVQDYFPIH